MTKLYGWPGKPVARLTIGEARKELVQDSIERKKLADRLIAAVREDEREKTLAAVRALYPEIEADLRDRAKATKR